MRHTISMTRNKFVTTCGISFHGHLLKGKEFLNRGTESMALVDCPICQEKTNLLIEKRRRGVQNSGRCAFIDLEQL